MLYNLEGNSPVVTRRTDFQLDEAKSRVVEVAENIAAGNFDPKPGFYCRFCAYRNLCPATEKRLQEPPPKTKQRPPSDKSAAVILSEVTASLREAVAQSKDPYSIYIGRRVRTCVCSRARETQMKESASSE